MDVQLQAREWWHAGTGSACFVPGKKSSFHFTRSHYTTLRHPFACEAASRLFSSLASTSYKGSWLEGNSPFCILRVEHSTSSLLRCGGAIRFYRRVCNPRTCQLPRTPDSCHTRLQQLSARSQAGAHRHRRSCGASTSRPARAAWRTGCSAAQLPGCWAPWPPALWAMAWEMAWPGLTS